MFDGTRGSLFLSGISSAALPVWDQKNEQPNLLRVHIVKSIHQIAHELGAQKVAKFVEDQASFNTVWSMGIIFAQGYGLHKPQSVESIIADRRIRTEV